MNQHSLVEFLGSQDDCKCGYCKGSSSCQSHGMWSHTLTVADYQQLIDRGWRRSGKYCYKPNMSMTCCPSYTIRCDSTNFKVSKSQKKIVKKLNRFLCDGLKGRLSVPIDNETVSIDHENVCEPRNLVDHIQDEFNCDMPEVNMNKMQNMLVQQQQAGSEDSSNGSEMKNVQSSEKNHSSKMESTSLNNVIGPDVTKPLRKKSKILRMERKAEKQKQKLETSMNLETSSKKSIKNPEKSLETLLSETSQSDRHKLVLKLVPSKDASTPVELDVYRKYQVGIHKDDPAKLTKKSFESFLVRSPLQYQTGPNGVTYGSFHQQYWLDDKLIAVGVIDILPNCISSVYFFYDPDYSFLSLGTYGSLREINFVNELCQKAPQLSFYYMGFYIHSCVKMRYKAKMHPSYLLCPEVYTWHLINDEMLKKLDEAKYQRLNQDRTMVDVDLFQREDLDFIFISDLKYYESFRQFIQRSKGFLDVNKYILYGTLVGKTLSHRMFLCK